MQVKQISRPVSLAFDEPNLIGVAGLLPVMRLAESAGLSRLVAEHVRVPTDKGANAAAKVAAVVAGMLAGADSIDDVGLLRHGAMREVFGWSPAPSTIGSFLRAFTWAHAGQLDAVASRLLVELAVRTPLLADGPAVAGERLLVDVDDTIVEVHGHAKQGAGIGYSGVRGLNVNLGTVTAAGRAPVIVASRLRRGPANSSRGIKSFTRTCLARVRALQPGAKLLFRADSAFYNRNTIATAVTAGADVSVTVRMNRQVSAAIAGIEDTAWAPISYLHPVHDPDTGEPVTAAEVAEVPFTAFAGHTKTEQVPGRLVVRRVVALNPTHTAGQPTLFDTYRYHAFFTTVPATATDTIAADRLHRAHAIIEQVHADLKDGPLAHLPSGSFAANTAWLTLATIAFNLSRAAGTIAAGTFTRATSATIRTRLITVPARVARSGRRTTLHLPAGWRWQNALLALHAPPAPHPA